MAHLVIDITGHGYGHLAQVAGVTEALCRRIPALRLTVRCALDDAVLRAFLGPDIATAPPPPDIGLVMHGPTVADMHASAAAYDALHADWQAVTAREAAALETLAPDLLLSDIAYSSLAAAARLDLPAVALCSLNWADIYAAYCGHSPTAGTVLRQMRDAYRAAELFIQPEPHMPMADLPNRRPVGPLARLGTARRGAFLQPGERHLVLVSLGGIAGGWDPEALPRIDGLRWIIDRPAPPRPDVSDLAAANVSFPDAMASADAVLCKTGYGTFAEAACAGVRVMYVSRPDWPESPYLEPWIEANATATAIEASSLARGDFVPMLQDLLARPPAPPRRADGAGQAAALLAETLNRHDARPVASVRTP